MVYSLGQRQVCQVLAQQKSQFLAQPSLRLILQAVHSLWLNGTKYFIRLNDRQQPILILSFLGCASQKYYFLC